MMLKVFNQRVLVISSQEIAEDVLDKRGSIYSSRPTMLMLDLCVTLLSLSLRSPLHIGTAGNVPELICARRSCGAHDAVFSIKPFKRPRFPNFTYSSVRGHSSSHRLSFPIQTTSDLTSIGRGGPFGRYAASRLISTLR